MLRIRSYWTLLLARIVPTANHLVLGGPALAALLTLFAWPAKVRRQMDLVGMVVAGVFAVLTLTSLGMLFLPTPAALFLSAEKAGQRSRPAA